MGDIRIGNEFEKWQQKAKREYDHEEPQARHGEVIFLEAQPCISSERGALLDVLTVAMDFTNHDSAFRFGSWVKPCLDDIDEEIHQDNEYGENRDRSIDEPVIAVRGRLDKMLSKSGKAKDRFDDERSTQ
jgi:hypothetical protein